MRSLSLLPLLSLALGVAEASHCKCSPSDPCWPSLSEWASLNETLSGRLIRSVPLASVCYPSEPSYNAQACAKVRSNWTSSAFHSSDPSSIMSPNALGGGCSPIYANGTSVTGDAFARENGCTLGNISPYVVNATEARHVQETLEFARKKNLRLNIKNTGHNAVQSSAHGSLSIWTHNIKQFEFHKSFRPQSCPQNATHMAATLGAGVQDGELFKLMAQHNAIAVGGTNEDVGVVEWVTGGGHGLATGTYGMGADSIIEAVIVTTSGKVLTANSCQNEDIFWAIRGGGGGTFGVILSVTVKAYPMPSTAVVDLDITARNGTSPQTFWLLIAELHKELSRLQDAGMNSYYTLSGPPLMFHDTMLLCFLERANNSIESTISTSWVPAWYDLIKHMPVVEHVGTTRSAITSRLLPQRAIEDTEAFAKVLETIGPKITAPKNGVSNPSISGTMTGSKVPVDNALNPAWRDTVVHLISSQSWDDSLPQSIADQTIEDVTYIKGYALRQLAPGTGAYFNEANRYEPNWQWSLFGPNYPRLYAIKQKYDPDHLLWCHQCVGSEAWVEQTNGSLCRAF
ncbi:hypothetical protein BDV36DRAFT_279501 [Aspergillus pseudocaelatus]|uniref:FAD-binding PCMH-type domain-containing protein n=1 Tax=Aspergillus pseudocaelatus TaxID=1825620 RepID=A0ABQ6X0Y6_9EURO|nr:hypothetical protein BDV36DRAFT_279501 [Aspergillus pseudocaelatus]